MEQIPDAPWIVDAEKNGYPEDEVRCPMCDAVCESIYTDRMGWKALGCEKCIRERDAWDWHDYWTEYLKQEAKERKNKDD